MTAKVKQILNIEYSHVPPTRHIFSQPFGPHCEQISQLITYYVSVVTEQLQSGVNLEHIEVDFCLSVLKPLHAQWLVNEYN